MTWLRSDYPTLTFATLTLLMAAPGCSNPTKPGFTEPPQLFAADGAQTDIFVAQPGPTEEPAPKDYLPTTGLSFANPGPGNWHWFDMTDDLVHFNEAALKEAGRDGGTAQPQGGLAIRPNEASSDLLIVLEGGNACLNTLGCEVTRNLEGFKGAPWCEMNSYRGKGCTLDAGDARKGDLNERTRPLDFDIFAAHKDNPFHSWNYVFIPYVSGDFMAGDNPQDVLIPIKGDGKDEPHHFRFRGRRNMLEYLKRIVPTFPHVTRVVVSGYSAGGMAAIFHFDRITRAFHSSNSEITTSLLVDSAMLSLDRDSPACVQRRARDLYRFDRGMPKDCKGCFSADGTYSEAYLRWLLEHYATEHKIGFVISNSDYMAVAGYPFGAVSKDETGAMRPCAKLDYGPSPSDVEMAASALLQIPNLHAAQRRVKQLLCQYPQASMLIVPDVKHVWFRSDVLTGAPNANKVLDYLREFVAEGSGPSSACL